MSCSSVTREEGFRLCKELRNMVVNEPGAYSGDIQRAREIKRRLRRLRLARLLAPSEEVAAVGTNA